MASYTRDFHNRPYCGRRIFMINAEIILTTNCNLRCKYCFENGLNSEKTTHMSQSTAKMAIDFLIKQCQIYDEHKLIITFFGGEPLLEFDLIKYIIQYINCTLPNDIVTSYTISTNGVLLQKSIVDFFINNNVVLQLSVDGTMESQDRNRILPNGIGSSIYYKNIFYYVDYYIGHAKFRPTFKMVVTPSNVDLFYQNILYLSKGNCIISFDIDYEATWDQNKYDIFYSQLSLVTQEYTKIKEKNTIIREFEYILEGIRHNFNLPVTHFCGAGKNNYAITPQGQVYPCSKFLKFKEFCLGNVSDKTLTESTQQVEQLSELQPQNYICVEKKCRLFPVCECKCPYLNYMATGDLINPGKLQCIFQQSLFNLCLRNFKVNIEH